MSSRELAGRRKQGPRVLLGDWRRIAEPEAALLLELDRFDPRESVPSYRRPLWNKAKAIIEGRQAWPRELLPWKLWRELRYFHFDRGRLPPWEDERNLTRPQRERREAEDSAFERERARRLSISEFLA